MSEQPGVEKRESRAERALRLITDEAQALSVKYEGMNHVWRAISNAGIKERSAQNAMFKNVKRELSRRAIATQKKANLEAGRAQRETEDREDRREFENHELMHHAAQLEATHPPDAYGANEE